MRPATSLCARAAVIFSDVSADDVATLDNSAVNAIHIEALIEQFTLAVGDPLEFLQRNELTNGPVIYLIGSLEEPFFFDSAEDSEHLFCLRQRLKFVEYLEELLSEHCKLVDQPAAIRAWSNKLIQLKKLRDLGFSVPRLPLSVEALNTFPMIMKPISECGSLSSSEVFYVQDFNAEAFHRSDSTPPVPLLAQERLLLGQEFRAYIISEQALFVKFARPIGGADVDLHQVLDLCNVSEHLPSSKEREMVDQLKRVIGLQFFSVDYVVESEDVIILEVNPLTSWSWLPSEIAATVSQGVLRLVNQHEQELS